MSQDFVIRLRRDGAALWSLIERETGRRLASGEAGPDEALTAPEAAGASRTLCLLPSEDTYFGRVSLPARTESEARQAAPYLIEDDLAAPLNTTEVALGTKDEAGLRWILAADAGRVEAWRERIEAVAPRPLYVLPDCAALLPVEAELRLFARGADLLFLDSGETASPAGGAMERSMERAVMPALLSAARGRSVAASPELGLAGGKVGVIDTSDLDLLASRLSDAQAQAMPPLFGGSFASAFDWSSGLRAFLRPAAIAAAVFVLYAGLLFGEGLYYRIQRDAVDGYAVELMQATFPDMQRVVNPRAQLNQRLAAPGGGAEGDFLGLMAGLSEISASVEAVRIDGVRYDAARGGLAISAVYSSFEDAEALRAAAEAAGFELEDGGAQQSGAAILGAFTLRRR